MIFGRAGGAQQQEGRPASKELQRFAQSTSLGCLLGKRRNEFVDTPGNLVSRGFIVVDTEGYAGPVGHVCIAFSLGRDRIERQHPVEEVGKRLRSLMTWIDAKEK